MQFSLSGRHLCIPVLFWKKFYRQAFLHSSSQIPISNTAAFLDKAKRYTDIQALTPELLRLFIQKIMVHEKEVKWSKHAPQTVEIHYADIGCMENRQTAEPEQHKDIPMVS